MEPLAFDSGDVGLIEATVSKLYSKLSISAVGADTRTQITRRVMAPELAFDDLDYSFDIGYAGEAQGCLILCDVVSSTIRRVGEGHDETFGPGDMFLISRPDLPYAGVANAPRLRFTVLDPVVFDRLAPGGEGVRVLDHRPVSRQAARRLRSAITFVRDSVLAGADTMQGSLVVSTATQYLAACMLEAIPTSAMDDTALVEGQRDATPETVRRATAFIDGNPDQDISLADIARAACVTPRAVQLAFRRHLDSTPTAYLRQVRLDQARRQLEDADPADGLTVSRTAVDWGFASPSRFARRYIEAFGETPSATLRR